MLDALIRSQGAIGLWVLIVGGVYLVAILIPLTSRASARSRLLLGTGFFAKLLSGLLFSTPGMVFNLLVLVLVVAGAGVWLLQPVPRLYDIQAVTNYRTAPGSERLIVYVGGWQGEKDEELVRLIAEGQRFVAVDFKVVDYTDLIARRGAGLFELARDLHPQVHAAIADPKYKRVVLIGHSVGGLLARWWAAPEGGGPVPPVRTLIDLAVPKQGADTAALAAALGLPPEALAEVGDVAGFPAAAQRRWRALEPTAGSAYCAYGGKDKAVPRDSALHDCARRDDLAEADHRTIAVPEGYESLTYRRPANLAATALAL